MAIIVKLLVDRKHAENAQTSQYTAPVGTKAVIDKFTITNTSAAVATMTVNLIPTGGVAASTNIVLKSRSIAPNETYNSPELVGQVVESGGSISTLASAAGALAISVCGREIV